MFGPNNISSPFGFYGYMHHRERAYAELLEDTVGLFRRRFDVPSEFDILLLSGSGTLGIEAAIASLGWPISVHEPGHTFAGRIMRTASRTVGYQTESVFRWMVQYETAESLLNIAPEVDRRKSGLLMVDAVSAFPYYQIPAEADLWVTVSSKQIGALPVLAIVVVGPRYWDLEERYGHSVSSYFDLRDYKKSFDESRWSPHTPAISLIADLREKLLGFDRHRMAERIDSRRVRLSKWLEPDQIVGAGPVLTVGLKAIPDSLLEEFSIYRHGGLPQVFLWSGRGDEYDKFEAALAASSRC